jgi:predicted TIM-barrel fold metal-dependent hydrolase
MMLPHATGGILRDTMQGLLDENVHDQRGRSRRTFLGGLATLGAAALIQNGQSAAQTTVQTARWIDVHHHFAPPAYVAFEKAHNKAVDDIPWILSKDLEDMDQNGTATAILSVSSPGFWFGQRDEIRRVARECNETAAKLRSDYPGRFGNFATVFLPDTEGALREIEYALDILKADGISGFSNYADIWLGDEKLAPIWDELNRRKAVVFIHAIEANCCRNLIKGVASSLVEYGADTTRSIASLIYSGTTGRFPDVRFIFSHGGGMMPYVIERFLAGDSAELVPGVITRGQGTVPPKDVPKGVLYELRKMYYDTAQVSNPVSMRALREVVPVSQIVYGTDSWRRTAAETSQALKAGKVFNDTELFAIGRGNIERILPRYSRE